MKRLALAAALLAGCTTTSVHGPAVSLSYRLATIDGKPLPAVPLGLPPDQQYQAGSLVFGPIGALHDGDHGVVRYDLTVADHGFSSQLIFQVVGGILHINLCPMGQLCIAFQELVGEIDGDRLLLSVSDGRTEIPTSVFRFIALQTD